MPKRKRKHDSHSTPAHKRLKSTQTTPFHGLREHPVLSIYYSNLRTLRGYLLTRLPLQSKARRRRLLSVPQWIQTSEEQSQAASSILSSFDSNSLIGLSKLLDSTLVGWNESQSQTSSDQESLEKELELFSQQLSQAKQKRDGGAQCSGAGDPFLAQSDLVDFVISHLFNKVHPRAFRPPHRLCDGYTRGYACDPQAAGDGPVRAVGQGISGVVCRTANENVEVVKGKVWGDLLRLLGKGADTVMLGLLVDCGVFTILESGKDCFWQLSGTPLPDLPMLRPNGDLPSASTDLEKRNKTPVEPKSKPKPRVLNKPGDISFVRNRLLYARAAVNAKGETRLGLRHIHVLNRFPDHTKEEHTVHIMKYIFPRQFGLHNVFTSAIDKSKTTQPFMDYTLREQELSSQGNQGAPNHLPSKRRVPKRLQGSCVKIVQKLQLRHSRCSYVEMIRHYCPTPYLEDFTATQAGEPNTKSLIDAATPIQHVSAFCQAIISRIIPHELFGVGRDGGENRQIVMQNIDRFIRCSRFENLTLHAVCQDLKVCCVQWLVPRGLKPGIKISISDFEKRKEILFELIYYIFDSLLVPLLRSNFHITESNTHKNRLFFFRHDVWRVLTEPSITHIKRTMLQELSTKEAAGILEPRNLGYSHMRVVPKGAGVRPIMNLKQRNTTLRNGKTVFGKAINSVIKPVQSMINCERTRHPDLAGASLFSVGDIYPKLKALQGRMKSKFPNGNKPLYFAKVDVQACFDTIPQANATKLMTKICSEPEYRVYYLAQIQQRDGRAYKVTKSAKQTKPMRKFLIPATSSRDSGISHEELVDSKLVKGKTNTIFSGSAVKTTKQRWPLVKLLQTHVEQNVVRIGKKFYRQKQGIPQGSTVSSLLCNLFYADFERECLAFLSEELPQDESLLLRLTDDFLLITTEREKAVRFLEIMHAGNESYGITVKRQKTLVNFDCKVDDENLSKTAGRQSFPYCGTVIDTQTLEITRDIEKRKENALGDSLTVETSKLPGQSFHHKTMHALRILMHSMYTDTTLNSRATVLSTLYLNFVDTAMKVHRYIKTLGSSIELNGSLIIKTIDDVMNLAFMLAKSEHKKSNAPDYTCTINKTQVKWLAAAAFRHILGAKQSKYRGVIEWLDGVATASKPKDAKLVAHLRGITRKGNEAFKGYKH